MGSRPTPSPEWGPTLVQTRLATRLVEDKDAYLAGPGARVIGRRIDAENHELFVVCGAADALALELAQSPPADIALHDLGATQSHAVLQAAASAIGRKLQHLAIRRQGYGDVLARIQFVELPRAGGKGSFRVYSTSAETPAPADGERVALTLLGHCQLGVLLAGRRRDAESAMDAMTQPMATAQWRNRALLLLPTAGESILPDPLWPRPNGLEWHDAPPSTQAASAWVTVARLWNQLKLGDPIPVPDTPAPAPTRSSSATPPARPTLPAAAAIPAPGRADTQVDVPAWRARLDACAALPGFVSGCVFELDSQKTMGHAGGRPGPASLAVNGAALMAASASGGRKLGLASDVRAMVLSLDQHHLALVPLGGGLVLHAVFDAQRMAAAVLQAALATPRRT